MVLILSRHFNIQETFSLMDMIVATWLSPLHRMAGFQQAHPGACAIIRYCSGVVIPGEVRLVRGAQGLSLGG